jgi:hypothetical protein
MQRTIVLIAAFAGIAVIAGVVVVKVFIPSGHANDVSDVARPAPSAPPSVNMADEERRADEERAKVMRGMNDHKKSTTAIRGMFPTEEAATQK